MNNIVFNQVIDRINNGQVQINLGRKWSFLFDQKCYPIHAFMAECNVIMGITNETNLYLSVFELSKLFPIATAEIEFVYHLPVNVN